jgi:hypothetical protein
MKRITLFLLSFLISSLAFADTTPNNERILSGPGGAVTKTGTLCSLQTATSTGCTASNGDEMVADLRGFTAVAFYSNQSTSTSYTCDVYSSDNGYDADSGVGQDRSTTSLANTQEMISLDGGLAFVWIECSSIANNNVTVTYLATK